MPDLEDFDYDASQFTTAIINSADVTDIYGQPELQTRDEQQEEVLNKSSENGVILGAPPPQIAMPQNEETSEALPANQFILDPSLDNGLPIPSGRSIFHHQFVEKKMAFLYFDMEVGGEYCGIIQMSAELTRLDLN